MGIWDTILNSPFIPMHVVKDKNIKKAWFESKTEKKKVQYDFCAKKYYYICFEYG